MDNDKTVNVCQAKANPPCRDGPSPRTFPFNSRKRPGGRLPSRSLRNRNR